MDRNFRKENGDNERVNKLPAYSFKIKDANGVSWKAGDAYGYEFARIRLPDNYIFGSEGDMPTVANPVRKLGTTIKCLPDSKASSLESIRISAKRTDKWKEVGNTKSEMKDI